MEASREKMKIDAVTGFYSKFASDEIKLLANLPEVERNILIECFFSDKKLNMLEKKILVRHFRENSYIPRVLMRDPRTFQMLEVVYENNVSGPIDEYMSNSVSGQALRNRLAAVIKNVGKIAEYMDCRKMANFGSGTGRDTIAIANYYSNLMSVVCADTDPEAIKTGMSLAGNGKSININYVKKSFMNLPFKKEIDIGLMIGILCGLEKRNCLIVLRKVKKYFKPGGKLIVSNILTTARKKDPLMAYILENIIGWKLVYKTTDFLRELLEEAGYKWDGVFYDEPNRFHAMAVASV